MTAADEMWAHIAAPVDNLRADALERPDVPWSERRDGLHAELVTVIPEHVTDQLLAWLDDLPDEERAGLLASDDLAGYAYQVVTQVVGDEPAAADHQEYDENAWFAYLAEHGTHWDGSAETWDAFREWFDYYAAEAGFGKPAGLLLEYLQTMTPEDRIVMLGQYGVPIRRAATPELDPRAWQIMNDLLARNPEFADIPEARRIELVTDIIQSGEGTR